MSSTGVSASPAYATRTDSAIKWGAAAVLVAGSLLFLYGGKSHPGIGAQPGATPADFFRAFAETVRHAHDWKAMHMMILVGPLCWAVAAPALVTSVRPAAKRLASIAGAALILSGALWAVAFVLDGFGAPVYAAALGTASTASTESIMTQFMANAVMMSRLGLVSWVAGGLGMSLLAAALIARDGRRIWRGIVAATGILLGLFPLLAALEGEYAAGPFTSPFWKWNALAAGVWYVALASLSFDARARAKARARVSTARAKGEGFEV